MTREQELLDIVCKNDKSNLIKAQPLVHEVVYLEEQMKELKKLPFIAVDKKNPMRQKATPASRQYKEFLQQYNNSLRLLLRLAGDLGEVEEESPLRKWIKGRKEFDS